MPTQHHGRIVWREIIVRDVPAAATFFQDLFGWTIDSMPGPTGDYTLGVIDGLARSGIVPTTVFGDMNLVPQTILYISVDDLEVARRTIAEFGGVERNERIDMPGIGSHVLVQDPVGALYYCMQPADLSADPIEPPRPSFGNWHWYDANTRDVARTKAYYAAVHGWTYQESSTPDVYTNMRNQLGPFGGVMDMSDPMWGDMETHHMTYIKVEDIDATCARVRALGGKVDMDPFAVPNVGRLTVCREPSGAAFYVIEEG